MSSKEVHDHGQRRDEDDHADVGGRERVADEDRRRGQREREEIRDKERAHKECSRNAQNPSSSL